MSKHRTRAMVAAIAVMTAVPVSVIAAATSGPGTAAAAIGATGPTGSTGATGSTGSTSPSMAPVVTTGGATQVGRTSAVLNGTVNPQGESTSYYFQYGTSAVYGLQSGPASAGSGTGNVAVHSTITGLTPGATYHYRLVAQNAGGTTYGADQTVIAGQGVSQVRFLGREGFVSPGRVIGVEAGCFGGTSRCYGHVTMSHNGVVIGQRNFQIAPNSGGFQNMEISRQGEQMLMSYNHTFHLLPVTVKVTTSTGQTTTQVMHLARWLWH